MASAVDLDSAVHDSYNPHLLYKKWFGGLRPKRKCKNVTDLLKHSQKSLPDGPRARFVCISDIHTPTRIRPDRLPWKFPEGDVLLVGGDLTMRGTVAEMSSTADWLQNAPYEHKIVIAGNHDFCLDPDDESYSESAKAQLESVCTYLCNSHTELFGCVKVFGSPVTPAFHGMAFNRIRGPDIRSVWQEIQADTDIVLIHGPPLGHCDLVYNGMRAGCADLLEEIESRPKPPAYCVFGHIHEAYGCTTNGRTTFVNAACCNLKYFLENRPLVFDMPLKN